MQKLFAHLIGQFREFYKSLTPMKKASISVSGVIIVAALCLLATMLLGTNYVPLFNNVPSDQLPQVVEQLQKRGIPFRIADNGASILISKDLLHSTQMAIMTEMGGSKVGRLGIGLEIFDKQDFGTSSYTQKINYQRALQGELMRAINTLNAVKESKVILALPPKHTFLEESTPPSASVVVDLQPGKSLSSEQVRGVTFLVASAVENLEPERVTVVDSRGKVLSRKSSGDTGATAEIMELKQHVQEQFEDKIESILSKVVGAGKVIAKVDASLNPRSTMMTEEEVNADGTALKSSQTEEEMLDGARNNPTGIPGSRSNLPGAEDQGSVGFKQNVRKEFKTSNFEVPKTVKNIKEAAGGVERLSVSVLVDGNLKTTTDKDGKETFDWQPRSAEEMKKLESLIKSAIGFSQQRGDTVTLENIAFQKEDFSESEKLLTNLERRKLLSSLLQWAILGMSVALFFFLIVRPFVRWITDSFQDTVEDILPKTIEELEELQSVDSSLPGMSGALPVLEEALDPDKAESELLKERILTIMEADGEKSAGAFSLWLSRKDL
jgi:flagellar M-ring protein FliF